MIDRKSLDLVISSSLRMPLGDSRELSLFRDRSGLSMVDRGAKSLPLGRVVTLRRI